MDVDRAEGRDIQNPLRQDLAVGHGDDQIRRQSAEFIHHGAVAEAGGLEDRQAPLQREGLDLGRLQLHAAVFRGIDLGIDADNGVFRFQHSGEASRREGGRTHEDDSHSASFSWFCISWSISSSVSM